MDEIFDRPTYMGTLSMPVLKGRAGKKLARCKEMIADVQARCGEDAPTHYWLAVISRYINAENGVPDISAFISHMKKALECDPDFLEAEIALKEGNDYGDPYFYQRFEDLRSGRAPFKDNIARSPVKTNSIDLVRLGRSITPALIIKYPTASIRSQLSDNTDAAALVSIDAVPPSLDAVMHALAIIYDDPADPLWRGSYLNLFPVRMDIDGIPIRQPDYLPFLGRSTALRLCRTDQCAIFVLDLQNRILMSRIICPSAAGPVSREEMSRVLRVVNQTNSEIDYLTWKRFTDLHNNLFSVELKNPSGQTIHIPAGAAPGTSKKMVFPVTTKGDRLMLLGN